MSTSRLPLVALLLVLAGPRPCLAQTTPPPPKAAASTDLAATLRAQAQHLLDNSRPQAALPLLRQAYRQDKAAKNSAGLADDLRRTGLADDRLTRYPEALDAFRQALPLYKQAGDPDGAATALAGMGLACYDLSRYAEALADFRQALPLYKQAGDPDGAAADLVFLGDADDGLSRYAEALADFRQALPLYKQAGDKDGEAEALVGMGLASNALGQPRKAIGYYGQALTLYQLTGDSDEEARGLSNLGSADAELSRYPEALDAFRQALPLYRQAGDKDGEAADLMDLGIVYRDLGRYAGAIGDYDQALPLYKQMGDKDGEAKALDNLGSAALGLGRYAGVIGDYDQALRLYRRVGDKDGEAKALGNLGVAWRDLGRPRTALGDYGQALRLYKQVGDRDGEAKALDNLGNAAADSGQPRKAIGCYGQALAINHQTGDREEAAKDLGNLMSAWKSRKQPRLAVFYGKQAVNTYQGIRAGLLTLDTESQQTYLAAVSGAYRTLAGLLIGQGRLPEAQQVLGLLKEQEFFDFVRRSDAEAGAAGQAGLTRLEAAQDRQMQALGDSLTALGVRRAALLARKPLSDADQQTADALDARIAAANAAFQAFLDGLPAVFAQTTEDKIATLRDTEGLQSTLAALGHHSVALYTLVGPDKLRLLLVTPQVQVARAYPVTAAALNRAVAAFRAALEDPGVDPRPLGRQLYAMLVGPVAGDLKGAGARTILWSLDGTLRYLPVAALYDGKRYLVETYTSSVFTPASTSHLADPPTAARDWSALGLGVSRKEPGFDALPGAAAELRGIIHDPQRAGASGILPGTALLDADFTQAAMRHALRTGYPVVHIASHFAFRPGNETDSFLLLGDGTHLSLADMKTMPGIFQGVDLLALSACDTATGGGAGAADGSEVESFGVLAQRKGAEAVLASLWPVSDASTPLLMEDFYRRHQTEAGVTKAQALQEAQWDLLRGTLSAPPPSPNRGTMLDAPPPDADAPAPDADAPAPDADAPAFVPDPKAPYAHPYYWAPFVLIGNWK